MLLKRKSLFNNSGNKFKDKIYFSHSLKSIKIKLSSKSTPFMLNLLKWEKLKKSWPSSISKKRPRKNSLGNQTIKFWINTLKSYKINQINSL